MGPAGPSSRDAPFQVEPAIVRQAHSRASRGFDEAAVLQVQVREELLRRLMLTRIEPGLILDAGAGTAHASMALRRQYPRSRVIALDASQGMLREARRRFTLLRRFDRVCADAVRLPLADASVDLVFSSLMLQWNEPDAVLAEFRRVLKAGGLLALSTLGPDSLRELRAAWAQVDDHPHVLPFTDMHDLGDALVREGFASPVLDVERFTLEYDGARAALTDLKANGGCNPLLQRRRSLTGRRRFESMLGLLDAQRRGGRVPLTAEVVFAHAWVSPGAPPRREREAAVPLEQVLRQLPHRRGRGGPGSDP